jgi:hypothetical protein
MNFTKPITSESDAEQFFYDLENEGLLFHPEDDPLTVVDTHGNLIFTPDDVPLINQRITEVYRYMLDPCEFIVDEFYPSVSDENRKTGRKG